MPTGECPPVNHHHYSALTWKITEGTKKQIFDFKGDTVHAQIVKADLWQPPPRNLEQVEDTLESRIFNMFVRTVDEGPQPLNTTLMQSQRTVEEVENAGLISDLVLHIPR